MGNTNKKAASEGENQPVWTPPNKLIDKAIELGMEAEDASDQTNAQGAMPEDEQDNSPENHRRVAQLHIQAALAHRAVVRSMYDVVKGWKPKDTLGYDEGIDRHLDEAYYHNWLAEGNTGTPPYTRIWQDDPEQGGE